MPTTPTLTERKAKLFRNGRNQAVRIPREFEFPGEDVIIRRDGSRLIIEPAQSKSLIEVLATFEPIDEELPMINDLAPESVEL